MAKLENPSRSAAAPDWTKVVTRVACPLASNSRYSLAFSPDGHTLATWSEDDVLIWDVATARQLRRFEGHAISVKYMRSINDVTASPDALMLATADVTAKLWDVATAKELRCFDGHTEDILYIAFSPDGLTLATGSKDGTARLWDVASAQELARLTGFTTGEWFVEFADGRYWGSAAVHRHLLFVRGLERREVPEDYRAALFGSRSLAEVREALGLTRSQP